MHDWKQSLKKSMRRWRVQLSPAARDLHFDLFGGPLPVIAPPQSTPLPNPLPEVVIATPCKNAALFLDTYFGLIGGLDYPREKLHLRILEGDSTDDTRALLLDRLEGLRAQFASAELLRFDTGFQLVADRTAPGIQRQRRSVLAQCRNLLLAASLRTAVQRILFVDVDLSDIPAHGLKTLLRYDAPVLTANCLVTRGQAIFDLNTFRYARRPTDREVRVHLRDSIYQPPPRFPREYPDKFTESEITQVHCVGGTFLLIDRSVAEAGVEFPETPYRLHLETEALSLKALDMGFGSFVVPDLIVRHGFNPA